MHHPRAARPGEGARAEWTVTCYQVESTDTPSSALQESPTPMAKKFQYTFVFKAGNVFTRSLLALGISFNGSALITLAGRKTGRPHSTPITLVHFDGQRYVQSPFGSVDWVRNLRAAGQATLSWGPRHETITVTELSAEQAAPVIKSLLAHAPKMIRDYFDVSAESSLADIAQDAPNHAVFAIHQAA
jgi:deazaflavin-dependent oxidoreductase (nitroreductase family)